MLRSEKGLGCAGPAIAASGPTELASGRVEASRSGLVDARSGGSTLLSVRNVSIRFGGVLALDDVSFDVDRGAVTGLIGPNGAGKTTLFNCLSRLYVQSEGTIVFDGVSVDTRRPSDMALLGVGRTFQNLALFSNMSVRRNVLVGTHCRGRGGFAVEALQLPFVRRDEGVQDAFVDELLDLLDLRGLAEVPVGALPFGTKKRVEMARALASRPKVLLLDEPAAGLNHEAVDQLMALIRSVRDDLGISVVLVEHHLNLVMRVSDKIVVLNFGRKICEGAPDSVQRDPDVITSYLGTAA